MSKKDSIETEGRVTDTFPAGLFEVELENGHTILAHLSGKVRKNNIKVLVEDRVAIEMSPYDLSKGRIVYRYR